MTQSRDLRDLLITETKRRLQEEGVSRIKKCLGLLREEEIWWRPNEHSNAVGNLVIHLCGNVRQWVLSTMGGQPDIRRRKTEFDERGPLPKRELIQMLDHLVEELTPCLDRIRPQDLSKVYQVQGFEESGVAILVHVVEHFSYHVGQITYYVKSRKGLDLGYYEDMDLDQRSEAGPTE